MSVREILDRTDLASVLTELAGEPTHKGRLPHWHCVDAQHADENPSVTMFRDRRGVERWKCWSGDHAGTAVDAVMLAQRVTTAEAVRLLEQRAGITPGSVQPVAAPTALRGPPAQLSDDARAYAVACAAMLWTDQGREGLEWLHRRGLTDQVLKANMVGFDPGHRTLHRPKGLPGFRPSWMPALPGVTYPSFSAEGSMIYVQTRYLDDTAPSKYANPSAAHGQLPAVTYPRSPRHPDGPLIITEGVPDGLIATVAGFRTAAVISTSLVTDDVANTIVAHAGTSAVVLAFDNDPAGRAAEGNLRELLGGRVSLRVLRLAPGHDLTDSYQTRLTSASPMPERALAGATR